VSIQSASFIVTDGLSASKITRAVNIVIFGWVALLFLLGEPAMVLGFFGCLHAEKRLAA
jgi:hypothetical protein